MCVAHLRLSHIRWHLQIHYFGASVGDALVKLQREASVVKLGLFTEAQLDNDSTVNANVVGNSLGNSMGPLYSWTTAPWVKRPTADVSLRSMDDVRYAVVDSRGIVVDEVEETRAYFEIYEGAVYNNGGVSYLVERLDVAAKTAYVRATVGNYFTSLRDTKNIVVVARERTSPSGSLHCGRVEIVHTVLGYTKLYRKSQTPFESVDLALPPLVHVTQAVWVDMPLSLRAWLDSHEMDCIGGVHAACHAILASIPQFLGCARADLGGECPSPQQTGGSLFRVLVFDAQPGGIGLANAAFAIMNPILKRALEIVEGCACDAGCPACVLDGACRMYNAMVDKRAGISVLRVALGDSSFLESRAVP